MSEDVFIQTVPEDPLIAPFIQGLFGEYRERYGEYFSSQPPEDDSVFSKPDGTFIVLLRDGAPIAMGAYKRYDEKTAELKRIWTHRSLRRQGLAQKVLLELERRAAAYGYQQVFLTTGFRQPEAVGLYLSHGYQPLFDTRLDPDVYSRPPYDGRLPFTKALTADVPVT
ncbi:GNAT superfamily N-acetyltransferase [Rahnella sp. BIGb0603]|jgi:GNAT superfamily N-acetyltransferase|uniref:GNAT family N-acetyltransferase n=1 Tax=Rahnella TaxID=34037 RepID=UPI001AD8983A|nr:MULTISPECIES: GNAT family N-acetyltransferase [Rahnella]MCS3421483.1 GNAT superfamily N-acetyltransferase [Rahnella sp. BIGb0603]MDF1893826.1 GNAT family N-acetyltransferase [Rahnella contaminans]